MIISEQKYTNKNRLYYRGISEYDESLKQFKETYLTTRLSYALAYSFGLKGNVEVYRLKDTANIFNMRSKTDEANLRKDCHLNSNYSDLLKYIDKLKNNDWLDITETKRRKLIGLIRAMGYDGYFNFEIDRSRYEALKDKCYCYFSTLQINSPSVAVFDIKKTCEPVALYRTVEEFEKMPEIKEIRQQEKDYIIKNINDFKGDIKEIFTTLRQRILTLTDKELLEVIEFASSNENKEKQLKESEVYLDALRKRIDARSKGKVFY